MMKDPDTEKARAIRLPQVREYCYEEELSISLGGVESLGGNYKDSYLHAKEAQEYYLVLERPPTWIMWMFKPRREKRRNPIPYSGEYAKGIAGRTSRCCLI